MALKLRLLLIKYVGDGTYLVNRAELNCIGIKLSNSELMGLSRI